MKKSIERKRRLGVIQRKILLSILGAVALGMTNRPDKYFKAFNEITKEFSGIREDNLKRSIEKLYEAKLIKIDETVKGNFKVFLSPSGEKFALRESIWGLKINPPPKWDGAWWIVFFDVPEELRKLRDMLRFHLKRIGFKELQKSVFIFPYPCIKEIKAIVEHYDIQDCVHIVETAQISTDAKLRKIFNLSSQKK